MKKISALMVMGILLLTIFKAQSQTNTAWQTKTIESHHITSNFYKTTNIIFPCAIVSVDIGSRNVLAQKAKGAENILQIKAAKSNFPQTNLTVVTADGKLTSFIVDYAEQPTVLNISFVPEQQQNTITILSERINQLKLQDDARQVLGLNQKTRGITDKKSGICFRLTGLFIHDELMFFRFGIVNNTNINYDIDQLRLYVRDQKKNKRTATQEREITPMLIYNNTIKISGQSANTIVFILPKFTIPDRKYLAVQLMEKNGGRHLELHVKNNKIVKAFPL